ncbi:MAG: amino acid decarboxylase [Armatimonadetes bacterium]|nr:amino acid decarboxylase [Armatimonadota bacterium]MDE2205601.1 amino acid decarboxylase [Armatimonadota bacterium]
MPEDEEVSVGDLPPEAFRAAAHRTVDWIADYLAGAEAWPVLSSVTPGEIAAQLPQSAPERGQPLEAILADFHRIVMPGITHWNAPGFMAYFAISGSAPGIVGEMLAAALNVNAMLWRTSPAATELEEVTLDWLRQLIGLQDQYRGVITDTASVSSLLAITAARERLGLNAREEGLAGRPEVPRLRLYTSEQAHSSIDKAAIMVGIGLKSVRKIPVDSAFRMKPAALAAAVAEDRAAGWLPFCVAATTGTTSTGSIDPVREIADVCADSSLWLHVDGAYGASAAVVPEFRWVLDGCDRADSLVVNPHKWLFTPVDCSVLFVRNPQDFISTFSLVPEYLKSETDVTNYMDWGVQLGRRFRALKLWMVLRAFGAEGLRANIRSHIALAAEFADQIRGSERFELTAPPRLSVVCFRARPARDSTGDESDAINEAILARVNQSGEAFLSSTRLNGRLTLRLAIGNLRTERRHVMRVWELLQSAAAG